MFRDRLDAAGQLAERLRELKGSNPLVLAIPRGGVPMGKVVADALEGELDVVLVHKVPAPGNPEYAIGAISEDGTLHAAAHIKERYGHDYMQRAADEQLEVLRKRRERYTPVRPPIDPEGRVVVVVDDGSATGSTMEAALTTLRERKPQRLIAALGAAPPDVVRRLEKMADQVVCLDVTAEFFAVGQFFRDFRQVSDEEVIKLLRGGSRGEPEQPPDAP